MNAMISWVQSPAAARLGWMLVHSLWQLALLAGFYVIVRQMLRRASAAARYLAACAVMICMVFVLPVTALLVAGPGSTVAPRNAAEPTLVRSPAPVLPPGGGSLLTEVQSPPAVALPLPEPAVTTRPVDSTVNWKERLEAWFNSALPWVVTVWIVGVLALAGRQLGGWIMLRRLCGTGTAPVDEVLVGKLRIIASRLGVQRTVRLLASVNVAVPSVIGHLKPVILLPASLISGLSPQQIEAILAHELAHVRRHDYLVNLIQVTCETVLFYHPAVWWISREIRREREHCCDDLAVQVCGDRIAYARTLATLEERRFVMPNTAMAATGGSLMQRIRRIVGPPAAANVPQGTWLAGMLVILSVCALIPLGFSAGTGAPDKFDFNNPPSTYEKGIKAADRNHRIKVDGLQFAASPLQWNKEGWLRLPKEEQGPGEELFLNLGVADGYEVVEIRLFDHDTRKFIHGSDLQHPGYQQNLFVARIGSTNWLRMQEVGGKFPDAMDVWLRIATARPGKAIVLKAQDGASAQLDGSEIVVTSLLEGSMNGKSSSPGGAMLWDRSTTHNQDRITTVNLENRGALLSGRYHLVAITKDGARHPMDHTHFWNFGKMNRHAYFLMDVALADVDHFELVPFKDRQKFFFNGLKVPRTANSLDSAPSQKDGEYIKANPEFSSASSGKTIPDRVVWLIESQKPPFVSEKRLKEIRAEFDALVTRVEKQPQHDPSAERNRAVLTALEDVRHLPLNTRDTRALNDSYLAFPDRVKTLQWEVFMALTRAPLSAAEEQRLANQRAWMRSLVTGLPDDRFFKRAAVLSELELRFADPLCTVFDRPMSELQFTEFKQRIEINLKEARSGVEAHTPTSARSIKPHNPLPHLVHDLVVESFGVQFRDERQRLRFPMFDEDRVMSWGAGNGFMHLGFESNRAFSLDTRVLSDIDERRSAVEAVTGFPVGMPPDSLESGQSPTAWFDSHGKCDFAYDDVRGGELIAVRGARLGLLAARNWPQADAISDDTLRTLLQTRGESFIPLKQFYEAKRDEHLTSPPAEYIGPYIGILTKENRLAVVHISDFSGPKDIAYNVRARAGTNSIPAQPDTAWGEPTQGVRLRIATPKQTWSAGTVPTLRWSATNAGPRQFLALANGQRMAQLEVDGVWYRWPSGLRAAALPELPPGNTIQDQIVTLGPVWSRAKKEDLEWRQDGWMVDAEPDVPLLLKPGKHTIRLAVIAVPSRVNTGGGFRVVSLPLEIVVETPPDGQPADWPPGAEAVASVKRSVLSATIALSQLNNPQLPGWIESAVERTAEAVTLSAGTPLHSPVQRLLAALVALRKAQAADPAGAAEQFGAASQAWQQVVSVLAGGTSDAPPATQLETAWGEAADGVQVRLHSPRQMWSKDEFSIYFKTDLRSATEHVFPHYGPMNAEFFLELDGQWYEANTPGTFASVGPSPATLRENLHTWITARLWRSMSTGEPMPDFASGRHVFRIGFPLSDKPNASGQRPRAVSNPVEVEVIPRDDRVSITGNVIGVRGKPADVYRVTAFPGKWSTSWGEMPVTMTGTDGTFTFIGLPDGPCDVSATPLTLTDQPNMRIAGVVVKNGAPVHITLSLEEKFAFSGRFTDAEGNPQTNRNVLAIWTDPDGKNTYSSHTKTDADGRYHFKSPFEVAERIRINDGETRNINEQRSVRAGRVDVDFQLIPIGTIKKAEAGGQSGLKLIPPILQSLKQEVVALSKEFPQLAGAVAVPVKPDEWVFARDCRDMGKRGYENTGPFPVAIGLKVMTAEDFRKQAGRVEMPFPYRWEYLGLVGWTTLHVSEGGEIPPGLVGGFQEVLRNAVIKIGPLNRQALAASLPQAIQDERDRLLAEADARIREGVQQLAETYPLLTKGQSWEHLKVASGPGRIGIHFRRQQGGKGATDTVTFPPSEAFGILVIIKPPPDEIEQLAFMTVCPRLGLVGQVNTTAADPALAAALKKLVADALAP